jgi:signal transduction histidine kinase
VNDILYISRIDAKMIQVKRQNTDFALTFDAHCHMGWSANLNTDIKTIVENPYEHLQIVVDEEMVGKVIEYLTHYAIFYTEEGMVRAKYEYRMGALNITIENTGKGISADTLPHVFDRFYRDNSHKQCGSGLLLPIVKGLVELMDGNIELSSEEGKGTTIWISIPCELVSSELKKDII